MTCSRTIAKSVAWTARSDFARAGQRLRALRFVLGMAGAVSAMLPWRFFIIAALAAYVATTLGTPHLRWSYAYLDRGGGARLFTQCTYLGITPFERPGGPCPLVIWRHLPDRHPGAKRESHAERP